MAKYAWNVIVYIYIFILHVVMVQILEIANQKQFAYVGTRSLRVEFDFKGWIHALHI